MKSDGKKARRIPGVWLTVLITTACLVGAALVHAMGDTKFAVVLVSGAIAAPIFAIGNTFLGDDNGKPKSEDLKRQFPPTN